MSIHCRCPACGAGFKAKDQLAGRELACPKCSAPMVIRAAQVAERLPDAESRLPHIVTGEAGTRGAQSLVSRAADPAGQGRKPTITRPVVLTLGWCAVLLLVVVAGVFLGPSPGKSKRETQAPPSAPRTRTRRSTGNPARNAGISLLAINWPEDDRAGSTVYIDGREWAVPDSGRVLYRAFPRWC